MITNMFAEMMRQMDEAIAAGRMLPHPYPALPTSRALPGEIHIREILRAHGIRFRHISSIDCPFCRRPTAEIRLGGGEWRFVCHACHRDLGARELDEALRSIALEGRPPRHQTEPDRRMPS